MKRAVIALAIAAGIYGIALGAGSLLYSTGAIGTGATHNDCAEFRQEIASERGISEEDVPQEAIRVRTQECLTGHELTAREAFRSEYLFWSMWPAAVCAGVFLMWPLWSRAIDRQESAEVAREASHMEPGT